MRETVAILVAAAALLWSAPARTAEEEFAGLHFMKQPDGTLIAGGLGWRAAAEKDGIRLGRRAHICFEEGGFGLEGWCTYAGSDWADIGLVRPGNAALKLDDSTSSWATVQSSFTYQEDGKPQTFRVWVTRLSPAVVFELTGKELRLFQGARVSRFARSDADWVPADQRLSVPPPVPRHFATRAAVRSAEEVGGLDASAGWLLAWYGAGSRIRAEADIGHRTIAVDCPVLLVFSRPPSRLAAGADGLAAAFAGEGAARVALLPLLGERLPKAIPGEKPKPYPAFVGAFRANHEFQFADLPPTEAWTEGLPQEVARQCEWWAERLREVPIGVAEAYSYAPAADTLSVRGKVEFLKLAEGGRRFAPLPPMLAVAARRNFALLSVEGTPVSSPLATKWGPYVGFEGADAAAEAAEARLRPQTGERPARTAASDAGGSPSYAWSVKGMGRYAFETRATGAGKEPEEVRRAFEREVAKVTEAGILAPWYPILSVGGFGARASRAQNEGHRLLWGIPGENLYYIGQCMDLAAPGQRAKLLELANAWEAKYPSEKVAHMPATADAPREHYLATIHRVRQWPVQELNFHYLNKVLPCEAEYYLAEYHRTTGQKPTALPAILEPYLIRSDWASLGLLRGAKTLFKNDKGRDTFDRDYGKGGVDDVNRLFAGLVGRIRLATMMGDAAEVERGMYYLARTVVLRFALEQWKHVLHEDKFLGLRPADAPPRSFFGTGLHTFGRKSPDDGGGSGRAPGPNAPALPGNAEHSASGQSLAALVVAEMDEFLLTMRECYVHVHWHPHRLIAYLNLVPELGRFLHGHLKAEVGHYVRIVEESNPEWYTPYADCTLAFETYSLHPADSYQVFLARAWVTGDPPETLWKYADLPWVGRGDWFYIHKLAETIRAYRGVKWEPWR